MAGLRTCSLPRKTFPSPASIKDIQITPSGKNAGLMHELTAAGLSGIFTSFPFNRQYIVCTYRTKTVAKLVIYLELPNIAYSFLVF